MNLSEKSSLIINNQKVEQWNNEEVNVNIQKGNPLSNMVEGEINVKNGKKVKVYIFREDAEYLSDYIKSFTQQRE